MRLANRHSKLGGQSTMGLAAVLGRIGGVAAGVVLAGALICMAGAPGAAESRASQSPSPAPGGVIRPPVGVIAQVPVPLFPGICPLQAAPQTVTVCWYDRSTDETKFIVYKRDAHGNWQSVYQVPTKDTAGSGDTYRWVDTDTSMSGQCYMIAAVDSFGSGNTEEECTVRPDPSRFPQIVPSSDNQWYGLSNMNDGTGDLSNGPRGHQSLIYSHETFGVDLSWAGGPALWKIEAQGGPHVMYGQAVALRVWGGGWLAYGNETFGVDLVLSSTPVYQWYVLGETPGNPIDSGEFALWNSAANRYLTSGYETWGVSLNWAAEPGTSTTSTYNASVTLTAQPPEPGGYVPFYGFFGGGPGNTSVLTQVSDPPNGPVVQFIKPGHSSSDCGTASDVIPLGAGASLSASSMTTLYGSATPSLSQQIPFLVCAATQASSVTLNLQYRD